MSADDNDVVDGRDDGNDHDHDSWCLKIRVMVGYKGH